MKNTKGKILYPGDSLLHHQYIRVFGDNKRQGKIKSEIKERDRIVTLICLFRWQGCDMGTSLRLGRLIDAINGEDKWFKSWLELKLPELKRAAASWNAPEIIATDDETDDTNHARRSHRVLEATPNRLELIRIGLSDDLHPWW